MLTSLYRSLAHHRLFAALNIGGLALGIATFLVLYLFVQFETGFDRVLPGQDKLWVMEERYVMPGYPPDTNPNTMGGELDQLRADFPQLAGTRYMPTGATVRQGAQATAEELGTVDPNFFELMRFPAAEGDPTRTLADPNGLVITQRAAQKYFGSQPAIGQTLQLAVNGAVYPYRVGAVLRDMPESVTFKDELFVPLVRTRFGTELWEHWGSSALTTFLRFSDAAAARAFEAQLPAFLDRHAYADGNIKKGEYFQSLRPLTAMHLYSAGDRAIVTTLGVVGLLTLLIAIVNYVNLATARAGLRAREVAMRKVLGGTRRSLIRQFLLEALATVALAALIGLALAEIALPFINTLGGTKLTLHYSGSDGIVLPMIALIFGIALVAGLYPAFVLSGFRPAAVLASTRAPGGGRAGARLRGALVVVQFAIAIGFAIGTGTMLAQTAHIRDADLGFKRDGLLLIRSFSDSGLDAAQRAGVLRSMAALPGVTGVTVANNAPGDQDTTNFSGYSRPGMPDQKISVMDVGTGRDYFTVYGARRIAGRLFDAAHADDRAMLAPDARKKIGPNVVLNRKAVTALGFASPSAALGQTISDGDRPSTIIGVIDNLRFRSPRDPVDPVAYYYDTVGVISPIAAVRYSGDPKAMTASLEAAWKRVVPGVPFRARSVEDNLFARYYKADAQRSRLFTIGAVLAILIGCIGLYGLAAFDTARRVKEIGIRKTLGASTAEVLRLLIGQFMRPVLIANLVAWPLAYVAMQRWLGGFDDRIALSPLFFIATTLIALLIAAATVFGQAWRVARAEPARALRYE
ncbi:ABC transporter permease [Sphingomonas sp. CARO-RG-8B-R24-01]|uniref:ABC transporter permease n=1 Tax=Sphingomonas sp. CARO-RG-8B-R24-01 TaxID=2914831 RepID=UPI001F5A0CFD|nr:ABC transporter permease [Sphingomonas sp. CARO-RG-8B-R24-01]